MQADLDPLRGLLETRRARALTATRRGAEGQAHPGRARPPGARSSHERRAVRRAPSRRSPPHRISSRLPQDGQDGPGDRRRQPGRGPARAAQGRQGAALPARVLRQPLPAPRSSSRSSRRSRACRTSSAASRTARSRPTRCASSPPRSPNPPTVMAMGVLVDRFIKEEAQARTGVRRPLRRLRLQGAARGRQGALRMSRVLATYNIKGGVGQDLGGGQPRHAGRARRRADAAVGPRPAGRQHLPVPRARQGQGRRRQARARQVRRRRADQGHRPRGPGPAAGGLLLPPHGPRARRRQASPTRRLGAVLEPLQDEYEYTFLDCPPSISLVSESVFEAADALLVPIIPATLSSSARSSSCTACSTATARRCSASSRWPTGARSCTAS